MIKSTDLMTDESIMESVKSGNLQQMSLLFERYHKRIFNFLARLTIDRDLAEDLTQNVFLRMIKYRASYRQGLKFQSWIYQVARNSFSDHYQANKNKSFNIIDLEKVSDDVSESTDALDQDVREEILHRSLAMLDEEQREILVHTRFQQLKYEIDGDQKMVFKNKVELRKYQQENGKTTHDVMSTGVDMDIILEIMVPRNMETRVESVYGMVEVKDFFGPISVDATYGGVDAALLEGITGELFAETYYGQIYTNLDIKFGSNTSRQEDFHTSVSGKPGTGPRFNFESKYGNVYLRKAN